LQGFKLCILGDLNFECDLSNTAYSLFIDMGAKYNLAEDLFPRLIDYTYHHLHVALGHKSSLDHVFISEALKNCVSNYEVLNCVYNLSDHLPIKFCLTVGISAKHSTHSGKCPMNVVRDYYCWVLL